MIGCCQMVHSDLWAYLYSTSFKVLLLGGGVGSVGLGRLVGGSGGSSNRAGGGADGGVDLLNSRSSSC